VDTPGTSWFYGPRIAQDDSSLVISTCGTMEARSRTTPLQQYHHADAPKEGSQRAEGGMWGTIPPISGAARVRNCWVQGMDCLDAEKAEVPIHARRLVPGGFQTEVSFGTLARRRPRWFSVYAPEKF
jgi:hypothetical protein